jgi:hypothetical protein
LTLKALSEGNERKTSILITREGGREGGRAGRGGKVCSNGRSN